ncbi:MAG: tetratricopeptide repeat protein [bacterium]
MFIIQLYSGQHTRTGDFIYRIVHAARGLFTLPNVEVANIDLLQVKTWSLLQETPLLILHHLSDPDLLPIVAARRKRGLPTVYELADNFRASHLHRPEARRTGPPDYHCIIEALIRRCDAAQATSAALQSTFGPLNRRFFVFPNLVETRFLKRKSKGVKKHPFTVGWGGSTRHFADLEHYADAIVKWVGKHPDVRLALMAGGQIRALFSGIPPAQLDARPPASLEAYFRFIDRLDVGLAPLLPTEFNACRSDVKFLEYASREVVPLCSRFGPYQQLSGDFHHLLLFNDSEELIAQLEKLRLDCQFRSEMASLARDYVAKNRLLEGHDWQARLQQYLRLFRWAPLFPAGARGCSTVVKPAERKHALLPSWQVRLLNMAVKSKDVEKAGHLLQQIKTQDPKNYQIHYFHATVLLKTGQTGAAIASLKEALRLQPKSVRAAQLLVQCLLIKRDLEAARQVVERAIEQEPGLPTLLSLKGLVLQLAGEDLAACELLDDSLRTAPRLVEASITRAWLAIRLEQFEKAERLADDLSHLIPDSAEPATILASACMARGDCEQAVHHLTAALECDPAHKTASRLWRRVQELRPESVNRH